MTVWARATNASARASIGGMVPPASCDTSTTFTSMPAKRLRNGATDDCAGAADGVDVPTVGREVEREPVEAEPEQLLQLLPHRIGVADNEPGADHRLEAVVELIPRRQAALLQQRAALGFGLLHRLGEDQ